jgi:hypothetical protein
MIVRTIGLFIFILWAGTAFSAHPLITDDTGTQGRGKLQIEINSEYSFNKEKEEGITSRKKAYELSSTLSYGLTDKIDIVAGIPYQWIRVKEDGNVAVDEDGLGDISLEAKWRFFEKDDLSLGLKPGVTLPSGDDKKGLGTGRVNYSLFFIGSKETGPWAFHLNLGYVRNENRTDERTDIWHASLAGTFEAVKDLQFVANIGTEKNPDKGSGTDPAFVIGGLIYSLSENLDVDAGIKAGLNKPETGYAILAGIAFKF